MIIHNGTERKALFRVQEKEDIGNVVSALKSVLNQTLGTAESNSNSKPNQEHTGRNFWLKSNNDTNTKEDWDTESSDVDVDDEESPAWDEQAWVRKKVASQGISVFKKAKESNPTVFQEENNDKSYDVYTQLPNLPPNMVGKIIHGVLSRDECQSLINKVPFSGPGFLSIEEVKKLYADREVERYVSNDEEFSRFIYNRIKSHIPEVCDEMPLSGISPEWRYLKYQKGGHQGWHIDGRESRMIKKDGNDGGRSLTSRFTIQMYLNDSELNYEGGEIVFLNNDLSENMTYAPKAGDCIIFYQEKMHNSFTDLFLMHKASNVTSGTKYALRSIVEYVNTSVEQGGEKAED